MNETFQVGTVSDDAKKLVKTTWECLRKSIEMGKHVLQFSIPCQRYYILEVAKTILILIVF